MADSFSDIFRYFTNNAWLGESIVILFSAALLAWIWAFSYRRLQPIFRNNSNVWDDTLFEALHMPLLWLIWLLSITFILPIVLRQFGLLEDITQYLDKARSLILVLTTFVFIIRYIRLVENRLCDTERDIKVERDQTTIRAVAQLVRITVIVIAILIALQSVGMKITTLLAFGGVGGLAVSFAAKDTIANFIGGLMIYWDRPFSVGDWIQSPDRNITGTVEFIGWRLTRIRTFDKRPLYVPNGIFSSISVENPSRMSNRRILADIGVRYDDATKVRDILKDLEDMLYDHPDIDTNQTLMVNFTNFSPFALTINVYTFTKTTNWSEYRKVQQDVFLKAIDIITGHGAECAFPTTTVHVPDGLKVDSLPDEK